jgi:uncharacterized protein (TIGR02266 family)
MSNDRRRGYQQTPMPMRDEPSPSERRQHDRVPINREFDVIEEYIAEYVSSISQGGVFIRSKNPLPMGTRVTLKFSVIVDDVETVEGEGEVVRVETDPEEMGMGVAFTRLSAGSKDLIDRIMERHRASSRSEGVDYQETS